MARPTTPCSDSSRRADSTRTTSAGAISDRDCRYPRQGSRFCALASPELFHVLTVEFGWTADQHREWLTDLLEAELLEPSTDGGTEPGCLYLRVLYSQV